MDAIDIDDFVRAAAGGRLRRLTAIDGAHWFPVVDVARQLGYGGPRKALRSVALPAWCLAPARELAPTPDILARSGIRGTARMVSLPGLVQLVTACRSPEAGPFRAWVGELVAEVQRHGGYGLEPAPAHGGSVLPPELVDVLVRLEGHFDEGAADLADYAELLRETRRSLSRVADSLERSFAVPHQRGADDPPRLSARELVESWEISGDMRAVACFLAPALVRGGVRCRPQDVTRRTGLSGERVRDCVRLLIERGCMREVGDPGPDGTRIYVLP
ncbi:MULTISPECIES: Bro-N domain-containing protein [Streptomyces]|uniref:DNA-binding protein n=1 Tax=Streptomyces hydrogenans TaxID=1873719 RepID=A0ABQ3PE89_9ACTN|nr:MULTISPECIES: Bro-N domain-containing protein [Streptomyces]MCM1949639.1 Bro-N domain-containing protein [Streptomyces sp. G2]GHG15203.1 DNA-binding protein [Streptomyces hydrogenans]GHI23344.1 DNA-binding protein [Streptomyces hydrogenans]GHI23359.1 DNA-binding protein [Streptomyces hydrogenans]GHI24172.1 DNA-binding protein [Streptomyces hydrogenans]